MTIEYFITQMKRNGGTITSKEMLDLGINRGLASYLLDKGVIERPTRGVYQLADELEDEMFMICARWSKCVFSHGAALFLHGYSDRVPSVFDITVPRGYNPIGLKRDNQSIRLHYAPKETYEIGIQTAKTPLGNDVLAYDVERCICDLVKKRRSNNVDAQLFSSAIKKYFNENSNNLSKLMGYAKKLNVYEEIYKYSEVLS